MKSSDRALRDLLVPDFISTVAVAMVIATGPNLVVQKVCSPGRQPSINEFICHDPELVGEAASITTTGGTIRSVISAVSVAIFGSWRDSTGRNRPLLFIGELTQFLCSLVLLAAAWNWSSSPLLFVVGEALLGGAFGAGVRQLASSCIIIESSKPEKRTLRLQIFMMAAFIAALVSSFVRGFLLTFIGYVWFFTAVAALHLLATALFMRAVRETKTEVAKKPKADLVKNLKAAFEPRQNGSVVWLMTICRPLVSAYFGAELLFGSYFFEQGFQLTVKERAVLGTYQMLIAIAGSFATPLLLTKTLKWSDFRIGVVSSALTAVSATATAFATTKPQLFAIALLDVMKYLLYSIPQSILSKCVKSSELGLFSGLSSAVGLFLAFGVNYLYKAIFVATSQAMPGAIYLISATGNFIVLVLFCVSSYLYIAPDKENANDHEEMSMNTEEIHHLNQENIDLEKKENSISSKEPNSI